MLHCTVLSSPDHLTTLFHWMALGDLSTRHVHLNLFSCIRFSFRLGVVISYNKYGSFPPRTERAPSHKHSCSISSSVKNFLPNEKFLFFIPLPPTLPDKMKTKAEVVMYLNAKTLPAEWPRGQSSDDWAVDCIKNTVHPGLRLHWRVFYQFLPWMSVMKRG